MTSERPFPAESALQPGLAITIEQNAGLVRMDVGGEVDAESSGRLGAAIEAALASRPERIEVSLTAVTFLDSSGIRTLMVGRSRAADQGSALVITGVQGSPRRVLEISGILDTLTSSPER